MARWAHATAFGPWSPIQPSMRSTRSGREIRLVAPSTEVRMPKTASTRCSARTVRAISNRISRPDLVERIEGWIGDQGPNAVAWAQRAMASRPDRRDLLAAYTGPALVLVGEEDELSPVRVARQMAYLLPDSDLIIVPRSGHMTSNESPQPVASGLSRLLRRADAARPVV